MGTNAPSLQVGTLARKCGKSVRAIRFYEELGLLTPAGRTAGGYRIYDASAVLRVHWIDRLQELGFSLPEIQGFLAAFEGAEHGPAAMLELGRIYATKLKETRDTIRRLQRLESELDSALTYLGGCASCSTDTPKSSCSPCGDPVHEGQDPPDMVAALTRTSTSPSPAT